MVNWGLATHFKDQLVENVNKSKFLSVGFDENLNQITHTCKMDIIARFWDVNRVQVRYWESSFMGHTTKNDLLQHIANITESMNDWSIMHLSIDGPSANYKLYRDLKEYSEMEAGWDD